MVVAFANNQVMVGSNAGPVDIYTDPVPMDGADRLTGTLNIEYIFNATTGLRYRCQSSMDGQNWVNTSIDFTETVAGLYTFAPTVVPAAFVRFKFTLTPNSSVIGACCFDLHVMLDHA